MRWYRYVEMPEWLDILQLDRLRSVANSCGDGKWVARHVHHAWAWGRLLDSEFPGRVVVLDVPVDVVAHACPAPAKIDGIGEATYILGRDLEKVRIVEAMEYVQ